MTTSSPPRQDAEQVSGLRSLGALVLMSLPAVTVLFFDRSAVMVFDPGKLNVFRMGVLVVGAQYLLDRARLRLPQPIPRWPLAAPTLAWGAAWCLACLTSLSSNRALYGSYERGQGLLTTLALAFFAYAAYTYRDLYRLHVWIPRLIVWSSVIVVAYGLIQSLGLDPLSWRVESGSSPVFSTLGRSNYLAGFLLLAMPLTIGEICIARRPSARWAMMVLLAAQGIVLLCTRARGAWLVGCAIVGPSCLLWGRARRQRAWQLGGAALIAMVVVLALTLYGMFRAGHAWKPGHPFAYLVSLLQMDSGAVAARLSIWRATGALIGQRPWLGYGPGAFAIAFARVYPPALIYYQGRQVLVDHAHNQWLHLAAECGVIGVLAALIFQAMFWGQAIQRFRRLRGDEQPARFLWMVALVASGFYELLSPPTATSLVITWALYGLALSPLDPSPHQVFHGPKPWPSWAVQAIGVGAAGLLLGLGARPIVAERFFALGLQQGNLRLVQQAEIWAPWQDAYPYRAGVAIGALRRPDLYPWAVAQLERALALCPAHPFYWAALGDVYRLWMRQEPDRWPQAEAAYRSALAANPDYAPWLRGLGQAYTIAGRREQAETLLRRAVALDATDAEAYLSLGALYYQQARYDDAALALMYARDLAPTDYLSLVGLGQVYQAWGRDEDAARARSSARALGASAPDLLCPLDTFPVLR